MSCLKRKIRYSPFYVFIHVDHLGFKGFQVHQVIEVNQAIGES